MNDIKELSVVIPCLNEAETLEVCISKAISFFVKEKINGEVIISDNGSTDGSQEIALKSGARLVHAKEKGYGSALQEGINSASGKFIIMGDADDSYDFANLTPFIKELRNGCDVVMGNRFRGGIKDGAMPILHRYLGNPILSFIGRLFFKIKIGDFHCGLRGFTKEAFKKMNLNTPGMEFASEMIVKASLNKMNIVEVPTILSKDGRSRAPHLRTWRDGWRHLRFLLMYSPRWLFLYPGVVLISLSILIGFFIFNNPIKIGGTVFDIHTLIIVSFTLIIGVQLVIFHLFVKIFGVTSGLVPPDENFEKTFRFFTLEKGLLVGICITMLGLATMIYNLYLWKKTGFSDLEPKLFVRKVLFAVIPMALGIQCVFYSFIFSILGIKRKK